MNVVFILSDQHNALFNGCYGHPLAETPAIDSIAKRGVRFTRVWCNSPLCVPSRAVLFSGQYVFENRCWDNALPWDGAGGGWGRWLKSRGVALTTIGKLDFKPDCDHGVEVELLSGHRNSRDIHGFYRTAPDAPPRWSEHQLCEKSGPRADLSEESFDDREVALRASEWIARERPADRPWVLNVNFLQPHSPWPCPPSLWEKWNARVRLADIPIQHFEDFEKLHPVHKAAAHHTTGRFTSDELLRRCYAGYLAHCEMVDRNAGIVLQALEKAGILEETLVIYASDHGENLRAHRIWGKMNMYEDALRVPLMAMGPDVRQNALEDSPVSLLDIFPTIADATGAGRAQDRRGISLLGALRGNSSAARNQYIFSEYHANGFPWGAFAVTDGQMKYVEVPTQRPMVFDLENDPAELNDLALSQPESAIVRQTIAKMSAWLHEMTDPAEVDARAKADQAALRQKMEADGSLVEEIFKRGYERRSDCLVPRPEIVPGAW